MSNKVIPNLPEGLLLNKSYTVGKCLGQGGFGITYVGYDVNLQRKVAIKEFFLKGYVYRDEYSYDVIPINEQKASLFYSEKNRFVDEARILARLEEQPGIVKVISYFEEFNTSYIVMEFIEGQALSDYVIQRGGQLSVQETLSIMEPVIKSLALIHQQGIVHRDISPDNIMLTTSGKVKLIDFGAAKTKEMNMNSNRVAKKCYSPPEQCSFDGEIGTYSDVYAMCATLYEIIVGDKMQNVFDRMQLDTYSSLSERGIAISPVIDAVITNGLDMDINQRIKNATDLYYLLYVYGKNVDGTAEGVKKKIRESSTKVLVEKMKKENKRRKYKTIYVAAIVIILLLGSGIILVRSINKNGFRSEKSNGKTETSLGSIEAQDNVCISKEEIYEYINEQRYQQGVKVLSISKDYEVVSENCIYKICDMEYGSTQDWNEAIVACVTDGMSQGNISGAGWLVLPYATDVDVETLYRDATANIEAINGNDEARTNLINCNKMGIATGIHKDGTTFVVIIFK